MQQRHPGVSHKVLPKLTAFFQSPFEDERQNFQELCAELAADHERNELIIADILNALSEKRTPLVITERVDHLETLLALLEGKVKNILILRGGMKAKEMKNFRNRIQSIPPDEERVTIAIGKCAGEGFDDPRLDTLFLGLPIAWKGTVEQYLGRLHRNYQGKAEVVIHDYVDGSHPQLRSMYKKREAAYKKIGYQVCDFVK